MSTTLLKSENKKSLPGFVPVWLRAPLQSNFGTDRTRLPFLDNLRYLMILLVLVFHTCGAYTSVAPHWVVHDTTSLVADIIRELFDVFMMPLLFFVAGFFAPVSLQKKGWWGFLKDKVRRLLVPWALAVFIVLPLAIYDQPLNTVRPFWKYWPWYLSSFEVRLRFTTTPTGPTTQAIYWFISLLFAFFLLFLFVQPLIRRKSRGAFLVAEGQARSGKSILGALWVFGLVNAAGHFILLLFFPDSSWFTLHALLEFQVTRLIPYGISFAFGVYAQRCGWFLDGKPLGPLYLWGMICGLLATAYLLIGQPLFTDTAGRAHFSIVFLLGFAFLRAFLLLSFLVVFLSFGIHYWNRSTTLDRQLSATSYDIYLTHYWFIVAFQAALLQWAAGPVLIKGLIVFCLGLGLSYALSRWVLARHSFAFAVFFLVLFAFCLAVRP